MPQITPNLWFDTQSEEAAEFYVSVFPNSKITNVTHYGEAGPREAGMVLTVDFVLDGQPFTAINGGPDFTFDEAVSFLINCDDQDEVDYYWDKLAEGGEEVAVRLAEGPLRPLVAGLPDTGGRRCSTDPDPERSQRAMKAMLGDDEDRPRRDPCRRRRRLTCRQSRPVDEPAVRVHRGTARTRLLDAAVQVIRTKGLSATSVDDLCRGRRHQGRLLPPLRVEAGARRRRRRPLVAARPARCSRPPTTTTSTTHSSASSAISTCAPG